jgi:hypothetical protein
MGMTDTHGLKGGGQQYRVGVEPSLALEQYNTQQACSKPSVKAVESLRCSKQAIQVQLQKIIITFMHCMLWFSISVDDLWPRDLPNKSAQALPSYAYNQSKRFRPIIPIPVAFPMHSAVSLPLNVNFRHAIPIRLNTIAIAIRLNTIAINMLRNTSRLRPIRHA